MAASNQSLVEVEAPERTKAPKQKDPGLTKQDYLTLYYYMRLTREFEMRMVKLYRQGKIVGGVYTGTGNEATAVGSAYALRKEDIVLPLHRDLGAHLVRGFPLGKMAAQIMGRRDGPTRGKDNGTHIADLELGLLGHISHLGTMIPVAAGVALAVKMRREKRVVINYIGEGGTNTGDFHEGLNFAAVLKLPLVLVIDNNQWAYSTPTHKQYRCRRLADRAVGYGIPGEQVDGTDVLAVYQQCKRAVERARRGEGPMLIESVTMRLRGHSEHDDASYVPKSMLEEWGKKDPIARFEDYLTNHRHWSEREKREIEKRIAAEVETAWDFAQESTWPAGEEAIKGVYAE